MLPSQHCLNIAIHFLEILHLLHRGFSICSIALLHVAKVIANIEWKLKTSCHTQCHVLKHCKMAANVCTVLKPSASTKSNRQGMHINILVVKGTAHTGICTKAMVITSASFGIGQFKESLKKKDEQFDR